METKKCANTKCMYKSKQPITNFYGQLNEKTKHICYHKLCKTCFKEISKTKYQKFSEKEKRKYIDRQVVYNMSEERYDISLKSAREYKAKTKYWIKQYEDRKKRIKNGEITTETGRPKVIGVKQPKRRKIKKLSTA